MIGTSKKKYYSKCPVCNQRIQFNEKETIVCSHCKTVIVIGEMDPTTGLIFAQYTASGSATQTTWLTPGAIVGK